MPRHSNPEALLLAGALALALLPQAAQAAEAAAPGSASGPSAGGKAQAEGGKADATGGKADATEQARAVLKEMGTTLAAARTMRFTVRSHIPMKAPGGDWVTLVGGANVMREGKEKLFVETGGDLFPFSLYFDGKTVTVFAAKENVFAQKEASGTIDQMLAQAAKNGEAAFVFADLVSADPYTEMTKGLRSARVVGTSLVDGVETQHLAVHGKSLDWEIWIGTKDRLPRMVTLTDVADARKPTHTVQISQWALDERLPPDTFSFQNSGGALQVPFQRPDRARGEAAARRPPPAHRP